MGEARTAERLRHEETGAAGVPAATTTATATATAALPEGSLARQVAAEWTAALGALAIAGALIAWSLVEAHETVAMIETDRLRVQARVVDDNVGQQLEGMNRALANVGDEYLATPAHGVSTLISYRLKSLSEAIPGVRSMVLLDGDGNVRASNVDAELGRDHADRDYFGAARAGKNTATLHVTESIGSSPAETTVVLARAIGAPNGDFAGVVAAAIEPRYFEVLLRSVVYARDMEAVLGASGGSAFASMPDAVDGATTKRDASAGATAGRAPKAALPVLAADTAVVLRAPSVEGAAPRMTALRAIAPPDLHVDRPLVVAVSRSEDELFAPWREQALAYSLFFVLFGAGLSVGLHRGHVRRRSFAALQTSAAGERQRTAEQLQLALQGADLALWNWDIRADRFTHNDIAVRHLGYAAGELSDATAVWRKLIHPDDKPRLIAAVQAHFARESPAYECEFRVRHRDDRWVWLLSRGKVAERDASDAPVRMAGTHMDVTPRKRAEAEMQRSAEMLRRTGELANIGGWELDLATMEVGWTEQVFRIHELAPGRMPRLEEAIGFYAPEGQPAIRAAVEAGARDGTPWDLELPFITARGNARWVRAQGVAVFEGGRPARLLGAFQDITEKKENALELQRLNEQLTRLSTTDALTDIGNRRLFDQTLKVEWQRAARRGGAIGLLMIDVDHFKEYNDHYGHPAGDACLRQIARMVGESVRRGGELVARYGGEEFALLLPGADLETARAIAERCRQRIADAKIEHHASATSAWLSVSIGVASQLASASVDGAVLVEIADAALYRAKRCGRGRIEY